MAFTPYYYNPFQQMQPMQQPAQQQQQGILWIQGEAAAKSYPVAPGQTVLLMDSESNSFYLKSADQSGMPLPLRSFDYSERTAKPEQNVPIGDFITRKEFEEALAKLTKSKKKEVTENAE